MMATTKKNRFTPNLLTLAIVAIVLVGAAALLLTSGGEEPADVTGSPTVIGDALPPPVEGETEDPAVGLMTPEVEGADFSGEPVTIGDDGQAKIIVFLAHWCPHCQREVPVLQEWVASGGLPEDVAMYAVATGIDPTRENYPPDVWLEEEGFTVPTLVDDAESSVGTAFGVASYPWWVFVDAEGEVVSRVAGELTIEQLDAAAAALQPGG